jgi:hypothetical protein
MTAEATIPQREAGMMITTGLQGVGKTYLNMYVIRDYVKDKFYNKVRGRKCLIFDTNGEYTAEQFAKNDIENFNPKRIAVKDVQSWSKANIAECRRIDASSLGIDEKINIVQYLLRKTTYSNGMLVLEDINTYVLNVTHMKEIVGGLVNLRHRAVDLLISYQSLRPVEPRIWQNARWIRMHYQADNVSDIKGKVNNPELMKISQIIVNNRYFSGDKRFYVYIHNFTNKVEGAFTKMEFRTACWEYLSANKREVKELSAMKKIGEISATEILTDQLFNKYFGNKK